MMRSKPNWNRERTAQPNWWTTLPGILTGIAGVLTAVGALVGTLYKAGFFATKPSEEPTGQRQVIQIVVASPEDLKRVLEVVGAVPSTARPGVGASSASPQPSLPGRLQLSQIAQNVNATFSSVGLIPAVPPGTPSGIQPGSIFEITSDGAFYLVDQLPVQNTTRAAVAAPRLALNLTASQLPPFLRHPNVFSANLEATSLVEEAAPQQSLLEALDRAAKTSQLRQRQGGKYFVVTRTFRAGEVTYVLKNSEGAVQDASSLFPAKAPSQFRVTSNGIVVSDQLVAYQIQRIQLGQN